jgi:hypothetical protein
VGPKGNLAEGGGRDLAVRGIEALGDLVAGIAAGSASGA